MGFRIVQQTFRNLTSLQPIGSNLLNGYVGDNIEFSAQIEWNSVLNFSTDADIILNPNPVLLGFAPGTNMQNFIYIEDFDNILDVRQFDRVVVSVNNVVTTHEILSFGNNFIQIQGSSFTTNYTFQSGDFLGIAPIFNQLTFDLFLTDSFTGFNVQNAGNYRWFFSESFILNQSSLINLIPNDANYSTFSVQNTFNGFNGNNFINTFTVTSRFILQPILLPGEQADVITERFTPQNLVSAFTQFSAKSNQNNNLRTVNSINLLLNGNTAFINQTLPNGNNLISLNFLSLTNLENNQIVSSIEPSTVYNILFNLTLPNLTINFTDRARFVIVYQKNEIESFEYSSALFTPLNPTRSVFEVVNFLDTIGFSFDLFIGPAETHEITGVYPITGIWQLGFTSAANLPQNGKLAIYLNYYPQGELVNSKSVLLGTFATEATPPDYGIEVFENERKLHFENEFQDNDARIGCFIENEVLSRQLFRVTMPNGSKVNRITNNIVAVDESQNIVTVLETFTIDTSQMPMLDGQFQNLVFNQVRYPQRANNDPFRSIVLKRIEDFEGKRQYVLDYPYIVRQEFWLPYSGQPLPSANFEPNEPFNGFNQFWPQYAIAVDTQLIVEVEKDGVVTELVSEIREGNQIVNYSELSETRNFEIAGGFIKGWTTNEITAFLELNDNEIINNDADYWGAVLWISANQTAPRYRLSSRRLKDPNSPWVSDKCTITKVGTNRLEIKGTFNGAFFSDVSELTFGAYLNRDFLPIVDSGVILEVENNILLEVENNVLLQVE